MAPILMLVCPPPPPPRAKNTDFWKTLENIGKYQLYQEFGWKTFGKRLENDWKIWAAPHININMGPY